MGVHIMVVNGFKMSDVENNYSCLNKPTLSAEDGNSSTFSSRKVFFY